MKLDGNVNPIPHLTSNQISRLFNFTHKHFVEYYDVQTELVDHLANGIEGLWAKNPDLSFDEALAIEFKKFGVYGFSDIVSHKEAEMQKRYHKFVWLHLKDFFTIPKIIFTISLIILLTVFFLNFNSLFSIITAGFAVGLITIILVLVARNKAKQKLKNSKKWLMQHVISNYGGAAAFFAIPPQIVLHFERIYDNFGFYGALLVSTLLVCWLFYTYIIIFIIPAKADEYLSQVYPEYEFTL